MQQLGFIGQQQPQRLVIACCSNMSQTSAAAAVVVVVAATMLLGVHSCSLPPCDCNYLIVHTDYSLDRQIQVSNAANPTGGVCVTRVARPANFPPCRPAAAALEGQL